MDKPSSALPVTSDTTPDVIKVPSTLHEAVLAIVRLCDSILSPTDIFNKQKLPSVGTGRELKLTSELFFYRMNL